jgi:uncharacterized protein YdhG (YjbR/CyaY superfamily)
MKEPAARFQTIDEYHASFSRDIQRVLDQLRQAIRQVAPSAEETISYNIPSFRSIVSYAGYKKHIGFYPGTAAIIKFKDELTEFKTSKGAIQFPLDRPLPLALIKRIVKFRMTNGPTDNKSSTSKISRQKTSHLSKEVRSYNNSQSKADKAICGMLAQEICKGLPEAGNKIWHGHPVWFLDGNPIAGYSKQRAGWRLMFWSGASFEEGQLSVRNGKYKDASIYYTAKEQINRKLLKRWLKKSKDIQWDYKNIVKRKGRLERLK